MLSISKRCRISLQVKILKLLQKIIKEFDILCLSMRKMFWLDLEMSGLDEKIDHILEVAVTITDLEFNILETYNQVVFQPDEVLTTMNEWCRKNHGESGLTREVPHGKKLQVVEEELIQMINRHYYDPNFRIVICGNSIQNDRRFIDQYWPMFAKRLHYRMIDVSSFKEVFREKWGLKFEKKNAHRALGDVFESIKELKFYLNFVNPPQIK